MVAGLATPESIVNPDEKLEKAGVRVVLGKATGIDAAAKKLTLQDGQQLAYDKLVLGTGSSPFVPPLPGVDLDGVFIMRCLRHAEAIRAFLAERKPKRLVFIGAGFISLEVAVLLQDADPSYAITIVELLDHPLPLMLDTEMAAPIVQILEQRGCKLEMGRKASRILGQDGHVTGVELDSGVTVDADMVFLNVGARPEFDLAHTADLEKGEYGLKVNDYLETSNPDILAGGDIVDKRHIVTGQVTPGQLRGPAVIMGRLIAKRLAGLDVPFPGVLNASACSLIDRHVAATGLTEQAAAAAGMETLSATVDTRSKHGMIPGCADWTLKLVFDRATEKLIGGQIVSCDIAPVKEIDAISALILGGRTAPELTTFLAAGNPDCSSEPSLEPITIAGEQALQKLRG